LEINRPQLPWWALLPGWVQIVLFPFAALWFLGWVMFHIGHAVFRYPLLLASLLGGLWLWLAAVTGGFSASAVGWCSCWRCGAGCIR
jgi:uncharacterized membrane protein YoaT (DUF817 family)